MYFIIFTKNLKIFVLIPDFSAAAAVLLKHRRGARVCAPDFLLDRVTIPQSASQTPPLKGRLFSERAFPDC